VTNSETQTSEEPENLAFSDEPELDSDSNFESSETYFDDEVQEAAETEEETSLAPVSDESDSKVAKAKKEKKTKKEKDSKKKRPPLESDYDRVKLEHQFHRIIQQLELVPTMGTPLLIGIGSSLRGEGRTTIAMGLASAVAQEIPLPVLLLETDLPHPSLAEDLGLPNMGLSEYIRGEIELNDLTQATALPGLSIIMAGDCNDQALKLLRSERLTELMQILGQQFAAIIVDLPPMFLTGEASRVISHLDRVLMVVEAGSTPKKIVKSALEIIPEEKLIGLLLNRTRPAFGFFQWVKRLFR